MFLPTLVAVATVVWTANTFSIPEPHSGIQSYHVKGRLLCGSEPAHDVLVKLVDDDFGPDPDDSLEISRTNQSGHFELKGSTTELTTIDPHLKVYHNCDDSLPCERRWKFELPNHYITSGKKPKKVLDIGTWNLEARLPDESHDCIH